MKCRLHSNDFSSAVGVCASCLRERLFLIISTQSQQTHQLQLSESHDRRRNSDLPPPLDFPRSVSPYVCQRQFDGVSLDFSDRRFHSTPQTGGAGAPVSESMKKKRRGKFSFITNFFKSRSDKSEITDSTVGSTKSKSVPKFISQKIPITNQSHRVSDRGMSPERWPYDGDEVEETSSRSSDSYEPTWKQTPVSTSTTTKRRHSNISGLAFCLSPLVRASPNRNRSRNSLPPESGGGGSVIASRKGARLAVANSFCKNRSKKMADFGGGGGGGGYDHRR